MAICRLKVSLFLWVCLVLPSILAKPIRYCDKKGHYDMKVKGVVMNPDPVVSGEKAEFKISASSDKKGHYDMKVKGVVMNPDPVVSGEKAEFKISASSGKSISGGKVSINVYFLGIFVHSEKIDLCKETPCPVGPGDFVLSHFQTLPGITPAGSYSLKMSIADDDNHLLTCIRFNFKIVRGARASVSEI